MKSAEKKEFENTEQEITKDIRPRQTIIASEKEELTVNTEETVAVSSKKPLAKAGKRSEKAIKIAEEKQAKEVRKVQNATESTDKHSNTPTRNTTTRTIFERKGKKFRKVAEQIEIGKVYSLEESVELAIKTSPVKFDATVELHIRLGLDPRQADQNLRDTLVLPAGTGKTVKVAVFGNDDILPIARDAGADMAASDEFLQQLEKGIIDFDILIVTPAMMPKLGKYARLLGPRGLMPNPKSGTVTNDVAKAVTEAKAGRLEYRIDSTGNVHVGFGKVSFGTDKLMQNVQAILRSIKANKPSSLKGIYIRSAHVATTMGPSIPVNTSEL